MSTRISAAVGAHRWARAAVAVGLALASATGGGCVRIDGGAVELSWVLRTPEGRAISDCSCSAPAVTTVRLHLKLRESDGAVVDGSSCTGGIQYDFPCGRQTGATPFNVPETKPGQTYLICVDTLDASGNPQTGVLAPAPVARTVVRGQPTDMGALLLQVECADQCSGMNGQGVCERP